MNNPISFMAKPEKAQISRAKTPNYGILAVLTACILALSTTVWAFQTECSYYTVKSCLREGTSGIMANGKALNDNEYTFASWDYRFGTKVKIRNLRNNREIVAVCTDRGPAKRLYHKGRKLDVSLACAKSLGFVKEGLAKVEVQILTDGR